MPVRIAFRLTEPDDDSDSAEWLLETVIIGDRGRHWTPAIRKQNSASLKRPYLNDGNNMQLTS